MSSEKMREFKAWWLDDQQAELRRSCAEGWALIIWQASRASIEVELPKERSVNGNWPEQVASDMGFNDGVELCRDAIESLGLKVKP